MASFRGFGLNYHLFIKDFLDATGEEITILSARLEEYNNEVKRFLDMDFDHKVAVIRASINALDGISPAVVANAINDYKLVLN